MITRSRILGTGFQTGPTLLTNDDLAKKVDTSDEWIFSRTGIRQRYIVSPEDGVVTSDLCADAGRKALEAAGLEATDLDLILVGTVTGDCKFPATGVFVQAKLGASNAAAMDLSAACSGFVYGLELADAMIRCGVKKHALVIGGEVLTSMIDWNDRTTCVLFGDAAGAVVLGPSTNDTGVLATYSKSNGDLAELLWTPGCGSLRRLSPESLEAGDHTVKMNGRKVYTNAVACMADSVEQVLARAGMTPDQIDLLV
ncbi:MAG: beta-ketoacyl-ACP synthase 3, partial [Candidatus Cloacimonetes bacterium]|nr:beta-ketoacyl-ACP synthase 3 [Candidatus Cloacimonadota bacterium]